MADSRIKLESTTETITLPDGTTKPATENQKGTDGSGHVLSVSVNALSGGQSESVAISTSEADSSAITTGFAVVTPTTDCFFRNGATALSNGTDQFLLGGNSYRITGITSGTTLSFITASGSGTVYITPGG